MSHSEIKKNKPDKKTAKHEEDYIISVSSFEGEILVKSKTLGRWEPKKFILDPENKILILKRKNLKKKSKVYELKNYVVEYQERKKDKIIFDLSPIEAGDKKLSLGSTNERFISQVINSLLSCCYKHNPDTQVGNQVKIQAQRKSIFLEKTLTTENHDSGDDEFQPRSQYPDHFNTKEIINNLQDSYQDDQYEVDIEQGSFQLSKNKKNCLQFKGQLKLTKNISEITLFNLLTNMEYVQKWNKFVTPVSSIVRPISEEKANLIYEQRIYSKLYPFPREYVYLRHSRRQDDRILILDRNVDAIDITTKITKGQIRYALWKIYKTQDEVKLLITMDATNTGFSIQEEDAFFTSQYLSQLIQLNEYINQNTQSILEDEILQNDPFFVAKPEPILSSNQIYQNEEQKLEDDQQVKESDQFFDCDEEEEQLNQQLQFENRKSIYQELDMHHFEEKYIQPLEDEITWAKKKMQQFNTGEYLSLYINHKYPLEVLAKQDKYQLAQLPDGLHFLYKDDWVREDVKGGLKMINQNKISAQKKVIKFLLKRIGVNFLTGKSIMSISMPVDIFETRSATERMCNALGFAPQLLDRAVKKTDPVDRMSDVFAFAIGFIVNFLSMEKPFNPILGETFQGWIEKCPTYAEQICHHPATTAFQMYGRGYRIEGILEMIANINSNSVVGRNQGFITIKFADQCIKIMLAPGLITGTAFGDRMFLFTGKTICFDVENQLVVEVIHQPDKKYCASMNIKHSTLGDYMSGGIFKVSEAAASRFVKDGHKKYQGLDKTEIREVLHKIEGRWTKDVILDSTTTILDIVNQAPSLMEHEPFPLASDANYRLDVLWWKLKDFDQAQGNKEVMEVAQRADKKLKEIKGGSKKH